MASSHTQHDGLHHAVSIDHHVHPPPPRDDLLSTDSDDEYEAQDSTTVGHDDLENIEKLSHGTRQVLGQHELQMYSLSMSIPASQV